MYISYFERTLSSTVQSMWGHPDKAYSRIFSWIAQSRQEFLTKKSTVYALYSEKSISDIAQLKEQSSNK
jgi:hypothetical protein